MPVTIKKSVLKYKNQNGNYVNVDMAAERPLAEQIAEIEAKGEEVLESIPSDYTELEGRVDNLETDIEEALERAKITYSQCTEIVTNPRKTPRPEGSLIQRQIKVDVPEGYEPSDGDYLTVTFQANEVSSPPQAYRIHYNYKGVDISLDGTIKGLGDVDRFADGETVFEAGSSYMFRYDGVNGWWWIVGYRYGVSLGETALTAFPGNRGKAIEDALDEKLPKPSGNGTAGQILRTDGAGGTSWENAATAEEIAAATDIWLEDNITNPSNPPLDRSLSLENAAAPADMVGNLKEDINTSLFGTRVMTFERGYYYDNNGVKKSNSAWKTIKARVENVFYDGYVHGTGSIAYYSTTYPSYIFMDDAGSVLDAKFVNVDNLSLITKDQIPNGAEWVAFNSTNAFTVTIKGIYPILDEKIDSGIASLVPESNALLDISVSDYISKLAENVYKRVSPTNLLHGDWTQGKVISADGTITDNSAYSYSDYFEVQAGKIICITRQVTASTRAIENVSIAFYDENKQFISRATGLTKTIPSNAVYARQNVATAYIGVSYKLMVEYTDSEGTIANEYSDWFEPYFEIVSANGSYYSNKKLCVFGDSLAANGSGGTNTWIQLVGDILGFDEVYNRGVGGSLVTDAITKYAYVDADGDAYNRLAYTTHQTVTGYTEINACCSSVDRANTIPTDTDVLLILAGANDVGNTLLATFETAYRTMLDNIYARIPNAKILVCTMPFHKAFDTGASSQTYENFRQAIRDAGHEYGFPVIDFKREMMVNKNNYTAFMDSDYVHYNNTNGRKRFAETAIPHVHEIKYVNN